MRKSWPNTLKVAVSVSLLTLLYRRMDWSVFGSVLAGAQLPLLGPVFGLLFVNTALSALKWKLLLAADGIALPFRTVLSTYWIGTFFNLFLPSSIGGDTYRIYDLARRSARASAGFASVFADRLTGFFAVATWGLLFSLTGLSRLQNRSLVAVPLMVFLTLALGTGLLVQRRWLAAAMRRLASNRAPKLTRFLDGVFDSFMIYRRAPRLLAQVMTISFLFQFLVIVAIWMMAQLLAWSAPFHYFCLYVPLITLIESVPISIFGLGVRDAAYVYFFQPVGVPREQALALALFYVALTAIYASIGGLLFLFRRVPAAQRAKEAVP